MNPRSPNDRDKKKSKDGQPDINENSMDVEFTNLPTRTLFHEEQPPTDPATRILPPSPLTTSMKPIKPKKTKKKKHLLPPLPSFPTLIYPRPLPRRLTLMPLPSRTPALLRKLPSTPQPTSSVLTTSFSPAYTSPILLFGPFPSKLRNTCGVVIPIGQRNAALIPTSSMEHNATTTSRLNLILALLFSTSLMKTDVPRPSPNGCELTPMYFPKRTSMISMTTTATSLLPAAWLSALLSPAWSIYSLNRRGAMGN
jgi:hypothetical protein